MTVTPLRQPKSEFDAEMARTPAADMTDTAEQQNGAKPPRGLSTIAFPYVDLTEAVAVARTILEKGGSPLTREQLAGALNHKTITGAFSAKIAAAKMFGLVEDAGSKVRITNLGFEAIGTDEGRSRTARAKAFLNVPLFERVRSEYRNKPLPPRPHALEQAMVEFGVLETRKGNARWSFDRSAKQAGYFDHGDDRLVEPIVSEPQKIDDEPKRERAPETQASLPATITGDTGQSELISGLFKAIPPPGTQWSTADQMNWLHLAATIFRVVHGSRDEIEIRTKPNSDKAAPNS